MGVAMQRTRRQILNILKHRGKATVDELAGEIKLSSVTVRAHLAILEREGLVGFEEVRGAVGRPFYAYSLTEKAEELFPNSYSLLANYLLDGIADEGGSEAVSRRFRDTAERIAADRAARLEGKSLPERVEAAAQTLDDLGSMASWQEEDGRFYVHQYNCPYIQVARRWDCACDLDLGLVAKMVESAEVERVGRLVEGNSCCTYVITPRGGAAPVVVEVGGESG
jgi:predicted ArsR family transcriptional regulator